MGRGCWAPESLQNSRSKVRFLDDSRMISDTKAIGTIGELSVSRKLISEGWEVFKDIADCSRIDLIALKKERILRIQVKTWSTLKNNAVQIERCKVTSGKRYVYTKEDCDIIATYVMEKDTVLFVPIEEFGSRGSFSVRFIKSRNNAKFKYFESYLSL